MDTQLECRSCSLGYDGTAVVEGIDFTVESGDYLCILGENGSGKSTLVKALLGLSEPLKGEVIRGKNSCSCGCGGIGYMPQQTVVQRDFPASVREIVISGCLGKKGFHPFFTAQDKKRAAENMERLGITDLAKKCYRELSGGQQQRVLLARALCAADRLLLLDEPVTGLDPKAQLDMYEMINMLNKKGVTIIMVSHDINAAVTFASHILHIGSKRQLFFGSKNDYLASPVGREFLLSEGGDLYDV